VKAVFSDDSIRDAAVTWSAIDPVQFGTAGIFTVTGTVTGTTSPAVASVTVAGQNNRLTNVGFESGDFTGWMVDGDTNAVDVSSEAVNIHDGKYALHYWLDGPFEFTLSQTVVDLPNGTYTLSAWIQGGGGEKTLQLFADCGGEPVTLDISNAGWQQWQNPTLPNIAVTNGRCTIGLKGVSDGGSWAFFDDVEFVPSK
jgi:arabinogalactan endo-1,4-beta-galactosidase